MYSHAQYLPTLMSNENPLWEEMCYSLWKIQQCFLKRTCFMSQLFSYCSAETVICWTFWGLYCIKGYVPLSKMITWLIPIRSKLLGYAYLSGVRLVFTKINKIKKHQMFACSNSVLYVRGGNLEFLETLCLFLSFLDFVRWGLTMLINI